jgi:hypothetical protein
VHARRYVIMRFGEVPSVRPGLRCVSNVVTVIPHILLDSRPYLSKVNILLLYKNFFVCLYERDLMIISFFDLFNINLAFWQASHVRC